MKPQIYVVEGRNDATRLKQVYPGINVVSVNGSAINNDIVEMLKDKAKTHEIILCMDPDYPGEKIRKTLEQEITNVSHVFINREIAFSKNKKKIGLEHLSTEEIKKALGKVVQANMSDSDITMDFLFQEKLIGHVDSKLYRKKLAEELNLGYVNGKTLLKRLNSFGIKKEQIIEINRHH